MKGMAVKIALLVVGTVTVLVATAAENILADKNGGFESGLTGWSLGVNGDTAKATRMIDSTSGTAKEGKAFHRITVTAVSSQNWHVQLKDPTWEAKPGFIYHFSMWARADSARKTLISVYGGPDSKDAYRASADANLTTEWQQFHQLFKADAEGPGQINFAFVCGGAVGIYDIDDVVITGYEDTIGTYYLNGDFEAEGATWSLFVKTEDSATGEATMTFPSEGPKSGTKFCRIHVTGLPESEGEIQLDDGSWTSDSGATYTFSFWGKASVDGASVQVAIQAGKSRNYAYIDGDPMTLSTEWTQNSYSYTADSIFGTDSLSFKIYCGGDTGIYDFDLITLSKQTVSLEYNPVQLSHQSLPVSVRLLPGRLQCVTDASVSVNRISIHDIQGRLLYTKIPDGISAVNSYDLPCPPGGMWIVKVNAGHTTHSRKIVVP